MFKRHVRISSYWGCTRRTTVVGIYSSSMQQAFFPLCFSQREERLESHYRMYPLQYVPTAATAFIHTTATACTHYSMYTNVCAPFFFLPGPVIELLRGLCAGPCPPAAYTAPSPAAYFLSFAALHDGCVGAAPCHPFVVLWYCII